MDSLLNCVKLLRMKIALSRHSMDVVPFKITALYEKEVSGLLCTLCSKIPVDPKQCNCGCVICDRCTRSLANGRATCSNCLQRITEYKDDLCVKHEIMSIKIKCMAFESGCQWTGDICGLESHLWNSCLKMYKRCELCGREMVVTEMNRHVTNECLARQVQCESCLEKMHPDKLHDHDCIFDRVLCSLDCGNEFERWFRQSHELDCPNSKCDCIFFSECEFRLLKKDQTKHDILCYSRNVPKVYDTFRFVTREHCVVNFAFPGKVFENQTVCVCAHSPFNVGNLFGITVQVAIETDKEYVSVEVDCVDMFKIHADFKKQIVVDTLALRCETDDSKNYKQTLRLDSYSANMSCFVNDKFIRKINFHSYVDMENPFCAFQVDYHYEL